MADLCDMMPKTGEFHTMTKSLHPVTGREKLEALARDKGGNPYSVFYIILENQFRKVASPSFSSRVCA